MGTNYIAPTWRMPENTNKDKLSNYSINFDGQSRTHIAISEVKGGPLLPGGQTYTSNVTVQNPKFSGSAFINFDTSSAYPVGNIVGVGQFGGSSFWFLRKNANNNIEFLVRTDAGSPYYATITGSTVLNANQWYHAAFSWDGNTITLYLNGSVDGSGSATTFYNSSFQYSGYASIGSYWRGGININTLWVGELSQVSIFDYALDSTQINYLYNLNNPMAISGAEPIAYWPLGDNSNPVTPAGYPNISVGADSVFEFSTQDNIESPHIDMTGAMSISGWFKTTDTGYNMIYHEDLQIRTGGNRNWFFTTQGNLLRFSQFYNNGTFDNVSSSGITVNDGNWHHGVFVWDGTTNVDSMKIFVDGILRGKTTASNTNRNNHNVTGMIGSSNVNYNMIGELSNIQIWDANLTYGTASNLEDVAGGQVAELYNNGQPLMSGTQPQETNLKAWYKLNQHDSYWDLGGNGKWTFNNAAIN